MSEIQKPKITQEQFKQLMSRFDEFLEERIKLRKPLAVKMPSMTSKFSKRMYLYFARKFLDVVSFSKEPPYDEDDARKFLYMLRTKKKPRDRQPYKPRTLLLAYSALKNLYYAMGWSWNIDWREIVDTAPDPLAVERPYLVKEEIEKVYKYVIEVCGEKGKYRDIVLFILLRHALRPEDIRRLKVSNLSKKTVRDEDGEEYDAYFLTYTPCKRGTTTIKKFSKDESVWIERYLAFLKWKYVEALEKRVRKAKEREVIESELFDLPQEMPLFPKYVSKHQNYLRHYINKIDKTPPISYMQLYKLVRYYVSHALGQEEEAYEKAYPYAYRIGVIVNYLTKGINPVDVTKWIGWKSPNLFMVYYKRQMEELASRFEKL